MPLHIAWRILTHQKGRTALALGGIFIAILLIFVELGFFIAVPQGGMLIYDHMRFDLLVTSNKYIFQAESWQFPRERLAEAGRNSGVAEEFSLKFHPHAARIHVIPKRQGLAFEYEGERSFSK